MRGTLDIVVIGGGGAGLAAAIEARTAGCEVVLLEKNAKLGGSTAWSVGSITSTGTPHQRRAGVQDRPQDHFDDMPLFAGDLAGRDNDELRRILCEEVPEAFGWLLSLGVRFFGPMPEPPHRQPRMHNVLPNSLSYIYHLERHARRIGVQIVADTRVTGLVVEGEAVVGAACGDGRQFRARRGVVLAIGRFHQRPGAQGALHGRRSRRRSKASTPPRPAMARSSLCHWARASSTAIWPWAPRSASSRPRAQRWFAGCRPGRPWRARWSGPWGMCRKRCCGRS